LAPEPPVCFLPMPRGYCGEKRQMEFIHRERCQCLQTKRCCRLSKRTILNCVSCLCLSVPVQHGSRGRRHRLQSLQRHAGRSPDDEKQSQDEANGWDLSSNAMQHHHPSNANDAYYLLSISHLTHLVTQCQDEIESSSHLHTSQ